MTAKNTTAPSTTDEATVPHQVTPEKETVFDISSFDEDGATRLDKFKSRVLNKKSAVAGLSTVILIAASVFVVKKRSNAEAPEDESSSV